jgi:hypothetical protein
VSCEGSREKALALSLSDHIVQDGVEVAIVVNYNTGLQDDFGLTQGGVAWDCPDNSQLGKAPNSKVWRIRKASGDAQCHGVCECSESRPPGVEAEVKKASKQERRTRKQRLGPNSEVCGSHALYLRSGHDSEQQHMKSHKRIYVLYSKFSCSGDYCE